MKLRNEEPKEHYVINGNGFILSDKHFHSDTIKEVKEFGNYFATKEEAEKVVEKLKAWKRLKDKGFRFKKWEYAPSTDSEPGYRISIDAHTDKLVDYIKDLYLLFGGEEE